MLAKKVRNTKLVERFFGGGMTSRTRENSCHRNPTTPRNGERQLPDRRTEAAARTRSRTRSEGRAKRREAGLDP